MFSCTSLTSVCSADLVTTALLLLVPALAVTMTVPSHSEAQPLPGTESLMWEGDLAARMVDGAGKYLRREIEAAVARRSSHWNRSFSSVEDYQHSIEPNRRRLAEILGVVDPRKPPGMWVSATVDCPFRIGETKSYRVRAVRWPVLEGVEGEGLLLVPKGPLKADVIALPDCDWSPEMLVGMEEGVPAAARFAATLAENGCRVLVPLLIDRSDTFSGNPDIRMTNQPHREFLYRPAYEMGRHIIGYEIQKVLAAVDWFLQDPRERPVGVYGYGEGGLIAFYAGAVDPRIRAVGVSGYFAPRENLWQEPIYRNVWSLLREFGDAEIASLIVPRPLIIEHCRFPEVAGPPPERSGRTGAAPGEISTPDLKEVETEVRRAQDLVRGLGDLQSITLVSSPDGLPGSRQALDAFFTGLLGAETSVTIPGEFPADLRPGFDSHSRLERQFRQILEHTQRLMRRSPETRAEFWSDADASNLNTWTTSCRRYRSYLWEEVIGKLPERSEPLRPRSRLIYEEPDLLGYEVTLDVFPDVFAYGILLVPRNLPEDEKHPVVVCQHGLEDRPQKVADPRSDDPYYHQFACRLTRKGYITFSPQNPYIGGDRFRVLQRMANPLRLSLFSFITRQHEAILEWLGSLPYVDPERIAFYGLSYGGKTAMRVPAILEGYCLSICSGDFNEWVWKNVSYDHRFSYLFTGEYEMPEFDIANTFNYAELSWLILPRPFMVERGHFDGVSVDEWVGYEYARTFRRYDLFGIGDRTRIEFFQGPHTIHGDGTFRFLDEFLKNSER